ncbi:hypothetical protein [Micromonospora carbonacea]|uniref:hypothetical protein n=1 Tax=Micromonospora carbonacea TaxID=47853 RepID=UPI0009F69FC6
MAGVPLLAAASAPAPCEEADMNLVGFLCGRTIDVQNHPPDQPVTRIRHPNTLGQ